MIDIPGCSERTNVKVCSKVVDNLGQAVRIQIVDGLLAYLLQFRCEIFACACSRRNITTPIFGTDIFRTIFLLVTQM